MKFLKNYYISIIKYDLINKFNYKTLDYIPALEKIILNFGCKSSNFKVLATCSLALELITDQKSKLTQTKKSNIILKIRKGNPVGCKVVLKKKKMYLFLSKLTIEIFPKMKLLNLIPYQNKSNNRKVISYNLTNILIFAEFEKNYSLFNNITNLNITFLTNTQTKAELLFFFNCLKLPFR